MLVGSLASADRSPPPPSHKYECQFQECFPSSQLVTGPNIALQLSSEPDICPAHFYTDSAANRLIGEVVQSRRRPLLDTIMTLC